MDGNLLFSLCDHVEKQVFQTWNSIRVSSPAKLSERYEQTNQTCNDTLLIADYSHMSFYT